MSEAIGLLVEALAKAKPNIKAPSKTKTGKISGMSKSGKAYDYEYKYADRADVIEAYKTALAAEGLILSHAVEIVGDALNMVLVTRLLHAGGGEIVSRIPIPQTKDAQALGTWLTYLERYASCAILDIAAEDDLDGRGARKGKPQDRAPEPPRTATATPKPAAPAAAPDYPVLSDAQCDAVRAAAKRVPGIKVVAHFKDALRKFAGTDDVTRVAADKYTYVLEQFELMNAPEPPPYAEGEDPFAGPEGQNS